MCQKNHDDADDRAGQDQHGDRRAFVTQVEAVTSEQAQEYAQQICRAHARFFVGNSLFDENFVLSRQHLAPAIFKPAF
jgi:hypothetical protein